MRSSRKLALPKLLFLHSTAFLGGVVRHVHAFDFDPVPQHGPEPEQVTPEPLAAFAPEAAMRPRRRPMRAFSVDAAPESSACVIWPRSKPPRSSAASAGRWPSPVADRRVCRARGRRA